MFARSKALGALLAAAGIGCLAPYDPPPAIASLSLDRGLYDPSRGPMRIELTDPVEPSSLEISLRLARRDIEGTLCPAEGRPAGCREPARWVFGPCRPSAALAEREGDGLRFPCDGGALLIDAEHRVIELDLDGKLVPYERYTLELGPGVRDETGRERRSPIEVDFDVAGGIPLAPTDFAEGTFFSVIETMAPVTGQFHFFFYVAVNPDTGQLLILGADADPADPSVDPKVNRDPRQWRPDTEPSTGVVLRATGQVAGAAESRALIVHPFRLELTAPPAVAEGTELRGSVRMADAGMPPAAREVVDGGMFAQNIFLGLGGERAELGSGQGTLTMFRLAPEETPPLESLLAPGTTVEDAFAGWGE